MDGPQYHLFLKKALATMKKGETAWYVFSKEQTAGHFNACILKQEEKDKKEEEEGKKEGGKEKIGTDVWIKYSIQNIKRNPIIANKDTFMGRVDYFDEISEICKECV